MARSKGAKSNVPFGRCLVKSWHEFVGGKCCLCGIPRLGTAARKRAAFWTKALATGDCWEWQARRDKDGYGYFAFRGSMRRAPVVAWFMAYGEWPKGTILHKCDNPPCIRPSHLSVGTMKENIREMLRKGRSTRAKLKPAQVMEIRSRRSAGELVGALALEYGVGRGAITNILSGRTWQAVS